MRVTVLGSAASHAAAGQACSGHLVEGGGARVLLDCGNGVLANAYKVTDPYEIDAVFVTHNHPDHYADLYSLQAMLRYAPQGPVARMPLYMPESLYPVVQSILSGRGAQEFREAFAFEPLQPGVPVRVGELTVTPFEVDHTDPTYALVVDADGTRLCYTADTAPGAHAEAAAQGAGLLLAEATLPEQFAGVSPHLTARQAAQLAVASGAKTLVLTHVWPTNDRALMLREASEVFSGTVSVASELDTYDVP
jgi:ribonuclease BN (tRNA processing enzyme)